MRKVLVIGSGGAGKTILAKKLGKLLDIPVLHLDSLYWKPGWTETPKEAWRQIISELVQKESWIMDGNYGGTLAERLKACDTVVYLVFSRLLCLYRVFKRALTNRGKARPDLNPGCIEQLPDKVFISWIWNYPKSRTPKILETLRSLKGQKKIFILRSPSEVRTFLGTMKHKAVKLLF